MKICSFCDTNVADTKCGCGYEMCELCFRKHLDEMDRNNELWPEEEKALEEYFGRFYTLFYPFNDESFEREDWEDWPVSVTHPKYGVHIDIVGRDH